MARPSELTEQIQADLVQVIGAGNTRRDAAEYVGIGVTTLYRWLQRGRKGDAIYRELWEAVKRAEAKAVIRNVAIIQKAAEGTWQAAAWWLERKRGEDWSLMKGEIASLKKMILEMERERASRGPSSPPPRTTNGTGNGHGPH